jgi:hypothetical protein
MRPHRADVLFAALFLTPAAVALGQAVAPGAALYGGSPAVATWVVSLGKLLLLGLAAFYSYRNARGLATAQAGVAAAWGRLAAGWVCYFLGQLCLAWYQLLRATDAPFPSVGDALFLCAYPLFFVSLLGFLRAYREAGFAVGSAAAQGRLAGLVSAGCLAVAVPLLHPAAVAPTRAVETALNLAYPILDLALVVPVVLLVRMTLAFRGGTVARMWASVLAGFAFMCAGDVLFAYFSALGRTGLDPFVHATYLLSYGLVADGARRQSTLLG